MDEKSIVDLRIMEILNALAILEAEGQGAFQAEIDAIHKKLQHVYN